MATRIKTVKQGLTQIQRLQAEMADAEQHLREMRLNLRHAEEWVRNAEALHSAKQRELAESLRLEAEKNNA